MLMDDPHDHLLGDGVTARACAQPCKHTLLHLSSIRFKKISQSKTRRVLGLNVIDYARSYDGIESAIGISIEISHD
jgi:hypothetical protein